MTVRELQHEGFYWWVKSNSGAWWGVMAEKPCRYARTCDRP